MSVKNEEALRRVLENFERLTGKAGTLEVEGDRVSLGLGDLVLEVRGDALWRFLIWATGLWTVFAPILGILACVFENFPLAGGILTSAIALMFIPKKLLVTQMTQQFDQQWTLRLKQAEATKDPAVMAVHALALLVSVKTFPLLGRFKILTDLGSFLPWSEARKRNHILPVVGSVLSQALLDLAEKLEKRKGGSENPLEALVSNEFFKEKINFIQGLIPSLPPRKKGEEEGLDLPPETFTASYFRGVIIPYKILAFRDKRIVKPVLTLVMVVAFLVLLASGR